MYNVPGNNLSRTIFCPCFDNRLFSIHGRQDLTIFVWNICTEGHVSSHSCVVFFLHECVWSITDQRSLIENPENRRFICREGRWYEVPVPVLLFVATFSWLNTVRSWYIAIIVFEELTKKHRIARLRRRVCSFVRERNVWLKASPAYFFVLYALSN